MQQLPLPPDGLEPCDICGAALSYRWTQSPFHQVPMKHLDACSRCEETSRQAQHDHRRKVDGPDYVRSSNVPENVRGQSLDATIWPELVVDQGNALAVARLKLWTAGNESLYLFGPTGSGKSTLARAAMLDCCRDCQKSLWLTERQLTEEVIGFKRDLYRRAWDIPVLVLDDVGSRKLDDRMLTAYRDIFDAREENGGKTLLTGQKALKEFLRSWHLEGEELRVDIASRLNAILGGSTVSIDARNRRIRKRDEHN